MSSAQCFTREIKKSFALDEQSVASTQRIIDCCKENHCSVHRNRKITMRFLGSLANNMKNVQLVGNDRMVGLRPLKPNKKRARSVRDDIVERFDAYQNEIRSCLECPICFEVKLETKQCKKNGHLICVECQSKLPAPRRCPQCRENGFVDTTKSLARLIEVVGSIKRQKILPVRKSLFDSLQHWLGFE